MMVWLLDKNRQATPPVVFCYPPVPGYFVSAFRHPDTFITNGGVFSSDIGDDSVAVHRGCAQSLLLGSESVNLRQCMNRLFCRRESAADAPTYRTSLRYLANKASVVCVLDDDPSVLKAACRLLDSAGWKVEAFNDPIAFLEYATIRCPRVAVIDIVMPAMNGLEVQTRLRSASPSTRVIILTSKDDPSVRSRAMEWGAFAFFLKSAGERRTSRWIESAMNGS